MLRKNAAIFLIVFASLNPCLQPDAFALKIDEASYRYPYKDPFLAATTVALMKGHVSIAVKYTRDLDIEIQPGRDDIYLLEGEGKLRVRFYQQDGLAPLVFIIPGFGGSAYEGSTAYLAELLMAHGFHVLVLPSPFNWNFALAASTSGLPGLTQADSKDLYSAMRMTLNYVTSRYHVKIGKIGLLGLSDGALYAAYLDKLDSEQKRIGFQRTLLINPPVNLLEAIRKIDRMASVGNEFTDEQRRYIKAYALGVVTDALRRNIGDPNYFANWNDRLRLNDSEMKYLIGETVLASIGDTIYMISLVRHLGILKSPVSRGNRNARFYEAHSYNLMDYIRVFLIPRLRQAGDQHMSLEGLNVLLSLKGIEDTLRKSNEIFLMHNRDDFLVSAEDLAYLEKIFGDRATIYPHGGHLGNLWYPQNDSDMLSIFEPLLGSRLLSRR